MGQVPSSRKDKVWYSNLCVSDEAWFTLGGHVFNRKNTVIYSPAVKGTPEQWISESQQGQQKEMVFCLLHGSGKKFCPFAYFPQVISLEYVQTVPYVTFNQVAGPQGLP